MCKWWLGVGEGGKKRFFIFFSNLSVFVCVCGCVDVCVSAVCLLHIPHLEVATLTFVDASLMHCQNFSYDFLASISKSISLDVF